MIKLFTSQFYTIENDVNEWLKENEDTGKVEVTKITQSSSSNVSSSTVYVTVMIEYIDYRRFTTTIRLSSMKKTIDVEKVLEIAYRILNDDDFSYFKKEIGRETNVDMKVGSKVILKDNLGFDNQLDRNKYNNMEVTIKNVYYSETGEVDIFFIDEDNEYYEWVTKDVRD